MKKYLFIVLLIFASSLSSSEIVIKGLVLKDSKVKEKPNLFSKSLAPRLSYMDTVSLLPDSSDKYYQIRYEDVIGYLRKDNIQMIEVTKPFLAIVPSKKQTVKKKKKSKSQPVKKVQPTKIVKSKINSTQKNKKSSVYQKKTNQNTNKVESNNKSNFLTVAILALISIGLAVITVKVYLNLKKVEKKYKPITDIEKELKSLELELEKIKLDISVNEKDYTKQVDALRSQYSEKKKVYDKLVQEVAILDETIIPMDFGVYKPQFEFGTSEKFKEKLKENIQKQREMVKDAIYSKVEVYVLDNKAAGTKMVNTYKKIAIRCFNSETDKVIRNVKWNNVNQSEQKIRKSYEVINKFLESLRMYIKGDFLTIKIEELHLRHEYAEKLYEEREARKEENAKIREEERAQREIENAKLKAEQEEMMYQKALAEAKEKLGLLSDEKAKEMKGKIQELESQLVEAREEKERAMSRAQLTRSGHVYIISNLGSFGEEVYKIGLTRRLEPMDRVKELGDASVPFSFDVHAMIYSEDAPALETRLHKIFDEKRVNQVNRRKEFFNVSLDKIEKEIKKFDDSVDFISVSEAKEYYQTLSLLEKKVEKEQERIDTTFPVEI